MALLKPELRRPKFIAQKAASSYYQLVVSFYCGVVGKGDSIGRKSITNPLNQKQPLANRSARS